MKLKMDLENTEFKDKHVRLLQHWNIEVLAYLTLYPLWASKRWVLTNWSWNGTWSRGAETSSWALNLNRWRNIGHVIEGGFLVALCNLHSSSILGYSSVWITLVGCSSSCACSLYFCGWYSKHSSHCFFIRGLITTTFLHLSIISELLSPKKSRGYLCEKQSTLVFSWKILMLDQRQR